MSLRGHKHILPELWSPWISPVLARARTLACMHIFSLTHETHFLQAFVWPRHQSHQRTLASACPGPLASGPQKVVVSDTWLTSSCSEGCLHAFEKVGEAGCLAQAKG